MYVVMFFDGIGWCEGVVEFVDGWVWLCFGSFFVFL